MADDDYDPLAGSTPLGPRTGAVAPVAEGYDPVQGSTSVTHKPIMNTSWRNLLGGEAWVPGGGTISDGSIGPVPESSVTGFGRYIDTSTKPSPDAGNILPLSRDPATGTMRLALPNPIRALTTEGPQLNDKGQLVVPGATVNPETGTFGVTPDAAAAAALLSPAPPRFMVAPSPLPRILELLREEPKPPAPAPAPPPPRNFGEARAIKDAWYDVVDKNEGAAIKPEYAQQGIDAAADKLQPKGPLSAAIDQASPATRIAIKLSDARDQPVTLGDFAQADSKLTGLIGEKVTSGNLSAARDLQRAQADLRQHFENAGPDDVVGGQEGFDALNPARKAHSQVQKISDVVDMAYKAGFRDNQGQSMRTQLGNYLSSDASRGLTDMERAALESAARRGALGTTVRAVGHMASPVVGGLLGGLPGAIGAEGTRIGAGVWGDAIAKARVQDAVRVLLRGVPPPPPLP